MLRVFCVELLKDVTLDLPMKTYVKIMLTNKYFYYKIASYTDIWYKQACYYYLSNNYCYRSYKNIYNDVLVDYPKYHSTIYNILQQQRQYVNKAYIVKMPLNKIIDYKNNCYLEKITNNYIPTFKRYIDNLPTTQLIRLKNTELYEKCILYKTLYTDLTYDVKFVFQFDKYRCKAKFYRNAGFKGIIMRINNNKYVPNRQLTHSIMAKNLTNFITQNTNLNLPDTKKLIDFFLVYFKIYS